MNLIKIRLPMMGIVSILHRISGVLMFVSIPLLVYLFHLSVTGEPEFERTLVLLQNPFMKLLLLLLAWSVFHHLFAGIRYLLIDIDIGINKPQARMSAYIALFAGFLMAVIVLVMLL
ncbi:MAG: succinate dehydrogenase, cytochrome b556 subunit [Gammaproteobacteria bacterium]|nr:MAG: succinate dehydrogenase, cytochrome b556 subunit [Gammaproteobacteria bacterium]